MGVEWKVPASQELVRPRPLRRLVDPLRERNFTYAAYDEFLDRLTDPRFRVAPLRELRSAPRDRALVGLRHDVDERLDSALRLARAEHARGLRATYFVLHTARYYREPGLLDDLRCLQDLGHEVGWHNDLVTLELVYGVDPVRYLDRELARLRGAGIDVVGTAAHGSVWCHLLGFHNNRFFVDFPEARPRSGVVEVRGQERRITQARLADFDFAYEAYHLDEDHYFSDSRFDSGGRRWHPEELDLERLGPSESLIVLLHPCHWASSLAARYGRLAGRLTAKAGELRERRRVL
jgi:hypothetical protein